MRKFYIILTDWDDVLKRVVAWVENPYIAISYFREYKKMDEDGEMVTIHCEGAGVLSQVLNEMYGTDLHDALECHLTTKTSKDNRCYVIYKEAYDDLFSDEYISNLSITSGIFNILSRVMLQTVPLSPYILGDRGDLIYSTLFLAYKHTSMKQMVRSGPPVTPISELIDCVYFWRYINYAPNVPLAELSNGAFNAPVDAVFIDSL